MFFYMKNILITLLFLTSSCSKLKDINPQNYFKLDGKKYDLNNSYYIDYGYSKPPFGFFERDFAFTENNLEFINTNENFGATLIFQTYTPGENYKTGTFVIGAPWTTQNVDAYGTVSINGINEEFEIQDGTLTVSGELPDIKIKFKGTTTEGAAIEANYSGKPKEIFDN